MFSNVGLIVHATVALDIDMSSRKLSMISKYEIEINQSFCCFAYSHHLVVPSKVRLVGLCRPKVRHFWGAKDYYHSTMPAIEGF